MFEAFRLIPNLTFIYQFFVMFILTMRCLRSFLNAYHEARERFSRPIKSCYFTKQETVKAVQRAHEHMCSQLVCSSFVNVELCNAKERIFYDRSLSTPITQFESSAIVIAGFRATLQV